MILPRCRVVALALFACSARRPADERVALREQARAVLRAHCGTCHIASLPTALPKALAIYDLDAPDWAAHMSAAQLQSAIWRLDEPLHQLMPGHLRPDAGASPLDWPNDATAAERQALRRFVELELADRAKH